MTINVATLFPEMFNPLNESIIGRAQKKGVFNLNIYNVRDYSADKHGKCDDYPFGGGCGMVMTPQPIVDCINAIDPKRVCHRIFMSPKGKVLTVNRLRELAQKEDVIILCGHYEGVDERAIQLTIDEEISIGDYVLTGGELPAMVLIDALLRFVPGVLGSDESAEDESFNSNLLEYPQYTRPSSFMGLDVPEVLLSGNHKNIAEWRREQSINLTKKLRPDLLSSGD